MELEPAEADRRLRRARVARLATASVGGEPHLVPITYAFDGTHLYFVIDHKPKSSMNLRRLRNIAENPQVSVLVDHYSDDWEALWWVRADGRARIWECGDARNSAVELLAGCYPQYREHVPAGPVVAIAVGRISGWSYRG
ncbi:PPOX class probable F420-dependent enzyme [Streptomyces sp. 846.5]|nr:TIGR03668 family PPOX class F420-dependent oxidoreductase [Streptomyces sp. 846.5]TDU03412.1 PPOX class probable F420-dependent enzyme [Streptomyces sp. 846.5]